MKEIIFNEGQLNRFTKKQIIELFLSQQEQLQKQTTQLEELNRKFDLIYEQLTMSRTDRFAQKTEKFDYDQLTLCFNEAEVTIETDCAEEPLIEEVIPAYKRKKRPKGKRDEDLSGLPVREEYHELSEKQLSELFPNGYRRLPDRIYKKLDFHPATFEVIEHHVAYYSAKNEDKIISAMIYSITETAKANQLKPYEYLKYLLIEIPKHMEDRNLDFLEELFIYINPRIRWFLFLSSIYS